MDKRRSMERDRILKIAGKELDFKVQLDDSFFAGQFIGICPFSAEFQKSGSHEYYAKLSDKLVQLDGKMTSDVKKNCLYYFEGWNALSIVIEDTDISPYQVAYVGKADVDVSTDMGKSGKKSFLHRFSMHKNPE